MALRGFFQSPKVELYQKNDSGFVRVKPNNPCRICGKTTWCTFSGDGTLAYCMRVAAGSIKQIANNAYAHLLNPGTPTVRPAAVRSKVAPATSSIADADTRNDVYRYLLNDCLTLDAEHGEHLLTERGFSDTAIIANLYASTPKAEDRVAIGRRLADKFGDRLRGVAGCYIDAESGYWRFRFPQDGFLIPCRDDRGRITGLMVRKNGNAQPKYYWISTPADKYDAGASSGAPIHYSHPYRIKESRTVIVTEGILKADRISEFYDCACIGIAGVHNFPVTFANDLRRLFPELDLTRVAFDADFVNNSHVRDGLLKLVDMLVPVFETRILKWELNDGKGLDDVLFNELGGEPNE